MLDIKGQIWYYVHAHLKVSGWLSDLNALLNRKLPIFFLRLNEIRGGRGNICLISGSLGKGF